MRWYSSLVVLFSYLVSKSFSIELTTRKGDIEGTEETSRSGRKYYAFKGIPYAQPPINELRLKNPQPHQGWKGTLDATGDAPLCLQKLIYFPLVRNMTLGQEDCLYLNIFTPMLDTREKLPILVYIHGGGFRMGMSGPKEAPAFFMDEDVILVSLHYRLGLLGFLSTGDKTISGNFGLKDQAMALKWLYENINDYGGNPESIVVFGDSAGAASTHFLMASPLTRDFIKGGISQSGVMDAVWALSPSWRTKQITEQVARMVDCNKGPMLECLQTIDAERLTATEIELLAWDSDPIIFMPVIEEVSEGAFMTDDLRNFKNEKPWITGFTNGEAVLKTASLANQDDSVLYNLAQNTDALLPVLLSIRPDSPGFDTFLTLIKEKYFSNVNSKNQLLDQIEKLANDYFIIYPMSQSLDKHNGPKYAYLLSHRAENSVADRMGPNRLNSPKACHGDELLSLFDWSSFFPGTKGRPEDRKVSELLVKLWVNFAKTQKPSFEDVPIHWENYTNNNFLHIKTENAKMEHISFDDIKDFWTKAINVLNNEKENKIKEEL
ncbi:venom carboxylesterase-6 [Halyomorpha halys]|uniref:venom carboxylesterase-6 n=1 Tax=Halyomorpha halys TaxID=286706 RepID=UPI0006D5080A|nr:venom carboxylesterase-6-like [Halyomorpha halys]